MLNIFPFLSLSTEFLSSCSWKEARGEESRTWQDILENGRDDPWKIRAFQDRLRCWKEESIIPGNTRERN